MYLRECGRHQVRKPSKIYWLQRTFVVVAMLTLPYQLVIPNSRIFDHSHEYLKVCIKYLDNTRGLDMVFNRPIRNYPLAFQAANLHIKISAEDGVVSDAVKVGDRFSSQHLRR